VDGLKDKSSDYKESSTVNQELSREAEVFHQVIFGEPVPADIRQAFVAANRILLKDAPKVIPVKIDFIIERSLDVEAIEFALRRRDPQNLLTKKLLIICYLAESRGAYFSTFVNEEPQPVRGFIKVSFASLRSAYKLLKGHFLIRIYDVV